MGQVQNLLHEVAKFFELISEQFILVLPNVYLRSDERGLGLLDQPTLILVQPCAHRSLFSLQGKNKIYGLVSLLVQHHCWHSRFTITLHGPISDIISFPPSLKVK